MESDALMAFLRKVSDDEGLRAEFVSLAGRYGVDLVSADLSDAALDQVSGGLNSLFTGPGLGLPLRRPFRQTLGLPGGLPGRSGNSQACICQHGSGEDSSS